MIRCHVRDIDSPFNVLGLWPVILTRREQKTATRSERSESHLTSQNKRIKRLSLLERRRRFRLWRERERERERERGCEGRCHVAKVIKYYTLLVNKTYHFAELFIRTRRDFHRCKNIAIFNVCCSTKLFLPTDPFRCAYICSPIRSKYLRTIHT